MSEKAKRKRRGPLCNPVIFAAVMEDPEICKELIERILPGKKVRELKLVKEDAAQGEVPELGTLGPETEKTIIIDAEAKSIRMDVLFEGADEWYDLEMQVENVYCPPKRSRYYHAIKAVKDLKRGHEYENLRPGYVIFICMFDYFGLGAPMYEFEMADLKKGLKLSDGQVTIFLNGECKQNVPEELNAFYRYLQTGEVCPDDTLIRQMNQAVAEFVLQEGKAMTLYEEILRMEKKVEQLQNQIDQANAEAERAAAEVERAAVEAEQAVAEAERAAAILKEREAAYAWKEKILSRLLEEKRFEEAAEAMKDPEKLKALMEEFSAEK